MMKTPSSVIVFHPDLKVGGSESIAIWAADGLLKDGYRVTVMGPPGADLGILDEAFGTRTMEMGVVYKPVQLPKLLVKRMMKVPRIWYFVFGLMARWNSRFYSVAVSGYNPMPFARPGVHLLGDFSFCPRFASDLDGVKSTKKSGLGHLLRRIADFCIPTPNPKAMEEAGHRLIVNSKWMNEQMKRKFGVSSCPVVYPAVPAVNRPTGKGRERGMHFVTIGRVVPEKRIETVVRILSRLRERGYGVTLGIVGDMLSSAYGVSLGEKLAEHKDWIKMHGLLIGEAKNSELARADYSVHARLREPLGIAIAELVDAGAVVFTPSDGGQFEVVNEIAELGYSSEDDAVEKIARVLDSSEMQVNLSNRLLAGLERFEPSRFNEAVRAEVASLISSHDQKKDACPGANLVVGVGAARLLGAKGKE